MEMTRTGLMKYLMKQLPAFEIYNISYDDDKGEWIIKPVE